MLWLKRDDANAQNFQVRGSPTPQEIEFPAYCDKLKAQIPLEPYFEQEGFIPGPSYQWYAWIGKRPLILECERRDAGVSHRVFVHTSYLAEQDRRGDWTVLLELSELPDSIHVGRPNFIMSRVREPKHVVFRPDPAGWNQTLYNAGSRGEAEELLEFLRLDQTNATCFIGPPEPLGQWSAIQNVNGHERVLCTYPFRNAAMSFACEFSLRTPSAVLVVKDLSRSDPKQYRVSDGQVVDRNP